MKMCEDDDELINVNEIAYEDVELLEIVGEGSFGTVHRAQWQGHCVAVKEITKEKDAFKKELRHLARVSHHNIIKLFGACTKSKQIRGKLWLITDYLEGGSLYDLLHRRRASISYQLAHAMSWALQCIKGVEYLHSIQMMHRDLKPPNLLLNRDGTHLKICDFGTVADKKTYMTNNMGSAAYMAPEVFRSDKYTEKCDVYSWAIILWEVLARKRPFYKKDVTTFTILWQVNKGLRPPLIKDCPPSIERLMTRCWQHDADVRPKTDEIVRQMERFCAVLPSVSRVPLTIAGLNAAVTNIEDEAELVDGEEGDEDPEEINQFPEWQESGGVAKVLPQPSGDLCMPLEVVVDPNAWELKDDFLDDLPLQNNGKSD